MKLLLLTCAVCALLCGVTPIGAEDMQDDHIEQTTESPIADMALVDPKQEMASMVDNMEMNQKLKAETQPHTIADFIIHPLIALKPRPIEPNPQGKQADTSSTTPSPWQLFGFNAGQGLGSSVSNLAGSVTGWLGNRIQLPGLVDTPVRESTSTSTSTTTTTTIRPDVVVRVQQRQSTRKPLISINNDNRPNRKNPNRINNNLDDSEEFGDDDDEYDDFEDNHNNNRDHDDDEDDFSNEEDDEEDESSNEDHDDEEEEEEEEDNRPVRQQNNNRRRNPRPLNNNNRPLNNNNNNRRKNNNNNNNNNVRRRFPNNNNNNQNQRIRNQNRRRPQQQQNEEVEQYDDEGNDQEFYYNNNNQKRSQNQQNFIQRGQQSLLNQIRQFTRGQTPAEVGNAMRKSQKASNNKKRRQQATLIINRNGQTLYVAPELLQAIEASNNQVKPTPLNQPQFQFYQPSTNQKTKRPVSPYPQPPLTIPYRRKGQPTQYITIPWSQLGIAPPDQLVSVTEGIQSQPLILNIPQSAINAMQNQRPNKKKQVITTEAVPLLAEASLMDIFKPPRIPPARTPVKPTKKPINSGSPVVIAAKTKPGPQRIRPGTIVEKAPADYDMSEQNASSDSEDAESSQFIVVGNDGEPGLGRNAFPLQNPYLDFLQHNGQQFAYRAGRQIEADKETAEIQQPQVEQQIPVQIVVAEEPTVDNKLEIVEEPKVETPVESKFETTQEEAKLVAAVETKVEDAKVELPIEAKVEEIPKPVDTVVSSNVE